MDLGGTTNTEVHTKIKSQLKGKYVQLFDMLSDGEIHDKDKVALSLDFPLGKKQKGFLNMLGVMKNQEGLITYPSTSTLQLVQEICFPFDE